MSAMKVLAGASIPGNLHAVSNVVRQPGDDPSLSDE